MTSEQKLAALRGALRAQGIDGVVIALSDEHMSEYVGDYAKQLEWLTGFNGTAGAGVVLHDRAAIFIDGRYTLQVRDQVPADLYDYVSVPENSVASWLGMHVQAGDVIGYDPWYHTQSWVQTASAQLTAKGAMLKAVDPHPLDSIWADRPAVPLAAIDVHEERYAGESSASKRTRVAQALQQQGAESSVIAALDSIAWLLNLRGSDVAHTPVARSFVLMHADGTATLFAEPEKITPALKQHLGNAVRLAPRAEFVTALEALGQSQARVLCDADFTVAAITQALERSGATVLQGRDPCILPKACKNTVEQEGTRAAHLRDGVAVTRFLHWLDTRALQEGADELMAVERLLAFRQQSDALVDTSFSTIAGFGPNGAIVHYRVSAATNLKLAPDHLFLIDSGGQYRDGTTDITRTVAMGTPTPEMCERFTRVLKGHIALATIRFPKGTPGRALDTLARASLWQAGLDYDHGTGHGVGSFLAVHEGPQRIAKWGSDVPLEAGMILSNEPGYYKTGSYGIRIENLVLVQADPRADDEREMLNFETLTLAPIDRRLIVPALLSPAERAWVDAYHARVQAQLGPLLSQETREWLAGQTQPL